MKTKYFNSWITALLLFPLIAIIGAICQIYSFEKYTHFFMAGFVIHGYLVVAHPFSKYSFKSIGLAYLAGLVGSVVGYLNESNSIVIALLTVMVTLHFTSSPTQAFLEFTKLDKKEQKRVSNIKWLKNTAIGIFAFIVGVIVMGSFETMVNNNIIKSKFEKCSSSKFLNFKNEEAIAIAKCYDENNTLTHMRYYDTKGRTDDVYYFVNAELDTIFDYYIGNKIHYLRYKIENIKKTKEKNIYKGIRAYFKDGKIKERTQVKIDYIEDKYTIYLQDGLKVFYDKNGNLNINSGASIYKDDKLVGSKKLSKEDIELFKRSEKDD